jgi:uncharacterized membrane protein YphA (DoxX/SURF4 family)
MPYCSLFTSVTDFLAAGYALPLRLIVGYGFMEHGYAKLARGPDSFTAILHAIGTPAPALLAWATICVELLGGLAVLLGVLIPLASIPMAIVLQRFERLAGHELGSFGKRTPQA